MKVIFDRFPYHYEPIKRKRKDYRSMKHPQSQIGSAWFIRSKTSIIYIYECYEIRSFDLTASDLKLKLHRATIFSEKGAKKFKKEETKNFRGKPHYNILLKQQPVFG